MKKEVIETVESPEEIMQQKNRADTFHYFKAFAKLDYNDYICVVVNIKEKFLVTAYPTNSITA